MNLQEVSQEYNYACTRVACISRCVSDYFTRDEYDISRKFLPRSFQVQYGTVFRI